MAFTIEFDYRFDTSGFFDSPEARAALEAAAALWENVIQDEFDDVPIGTSFEVRNPTTSAFETVTLTSAVDDIIVFVGATNFSGSTLAIAGPDGVNAAGDVYAARISSDFRGNGPVTDFEPWAGSISFDGDTNWFFGPGTPAGSQSDFTSVAAHEIGHILGVGTSSAFDRWVINDVFTGPNATAANGGQGVPLESDHGHVEDGFAGDEVLLDPTLTQGEQIEISVFDKAILADIGYEIAGFSKQGSTQPIATQGAERIFGTDLADVINALGGNDTIQGGDGNDELRGGSGSDQLFGQGGTDTFVIGAGDGQNTISDFDLNTETIRLVDSGFASAAEAAQAITKAFSNVSRLTFNDGTTVDIFHASQSGTPLNASHFEIEGGGQQPPDSPPTPSNSDPVGSVVIEGEARVGETLRANTDAITDADGLGAFSYVWIRDNGTIPGATGATYTLTDQDENATIRVGVVYRDGKGIVETLNSAPTNPIQSEDSNSGDPGTEPEGSDDMSSEDEITLDGETQDDATTPETEGTEDGGDGGSEDAPEDTGPTQVFVIDPVRGPFEITDFNLNSDQLDLSAFIRSDVTEAVLNATGTDSAVLQFFDGTVVTIRGTGVTGDTIVQADFVVSGSNSAALGTISIDGETDVGSTLTATVGDISDGDGVLQDTFSLQWYRGETLIEGATEATYVVTAEDAGAVLTVKLTYTDLYGRQEIILSEDFSLGGDGGQGGGDGDGSDDGGGDGSDGGDGGDGGDDEPDDPGKTDGVNDTPVTATPFNDVFAARSDMSFIDGGDGIDTVVLTGSQTNYTLSIGVNGMSISDKRPDGVGTITLSNIERLNFEFGPLEDAGPMDLTQFSGHTNLNSEDFEAFIEMYIAYFNRAPDALGLAFWATAYANGTTLEEMAQLFLDQDETRDVYPEDTSSVRFVAEVYSNVLGRNPDLEGLQFWKNTLDSGAVSQDEFILQLLRGVDAAPASDAPTSFVEKQQADQAYLELKTDLGALFAVHRGMSDVTDAANIMAMFDGSQESLEAAVAAINAAYADAMDAETGEFLMPLVGVLDTPFGM